MNMTQVAGNGSGRLRILLAGKDQADLSDLRELLLRAGAERLTIDCVHSREETRTQVKNTDYDLLLVDYPEKDGGARHWLRDADGSEVRVPVVFLGEYFNHGGMEAAIQVAACNRLPGCNRAVPCLGLYVLSGIEDHLKQRQRRNSEETLRKLRHSVEQSPDLVMITNSAGVLEYVNPAFEKLTGYTSDEVLGQTLGILKSDQQSGELYEEMWNTVLSGKVFNGTVMNRKKNGETFVIEKAITPLRNGEGRITHFISTGRDITDQKKLESQLHQSQKMDAIGRLAGGVAHDFNNLLTSINGYANWCWNDFTPEDPIRRTIEEIMKATRRAADLTRQLLAFGRKQMLAPRVLDLNAVVAERSPDAAAFDRRGYRTGVRSGARPGEGESRSGANRADPNEPGRQRTRCHAGGWQARPSKRPTSSSTTPMPAAPRSFHPGRYVMLAVSDTGTGMDAATQGSYLRALLYHQRAG